MDHSPSTWSYWAESADQNKSAINAAISPYLRSANKVLELGSGTGQHAVFFTQQNPSLLWQPTEHPNNHQMLKENLSRHGGPNIEAAIALDASIDSWPDLPCDLFYSANTLHIMSWPSVCQLFKHLGALLQPEQRALIYGPFRFADQPFATSNAAFDQHLKRVDPASGIRAIEQLETQATANGLRLEHAIEMPANNHILVWQRTIS